MVVRWGARREKDGRLFFRMGICWWWEYGTEAGTKLGSGRLSAPTVREKAGWSSKIGPAPKKKRAA